MLLSWVLALTLTMVSLATTSRAMELPLQVVAPPGLDEDLHAAAELQSQVRGPLFLEVVDRQDAAVLQLLFRGDEGPQTRVQRRFLLEGGVRQDVAVLPLTSRGDGEQQVQGGACIVLDVNLYVVDGIVMHSLPPHLIPPFPSCPHPTPFPQMSPRLQDL